MNTLQQIRIATRRSPLALWQAHAIKQQLEQCAPHVQVSLVEIVTQGDIFLSDRLSERGGKGLFVKELELALIEGKADIAVHSMKDMTVSMPPALCLAAVSAREDVRDVLITQNAKTLQTLPQAAIVGTSSLRRQAQLLAIRPDLCIRSLRGNVNTRLNKLSAGEYDAIILAAAGLIRLGLTQHIQAYLSVSEMLPAIGQAIMGMQCRANDHDLRTLLRAINNKEAEYCLTAERTLNATLGGHCASPIAGFAEIKSGRLQLVGKVFSPDGSVQLAASGAAACEDGVDLGQQVAQNLLAQGAARWLDTENNID